MDQELFVISIWKMKKTIWVYSCCQVQFNSILPETPNNNSKEYFWAPSLSLLVVFISSVLFCTVLFPLFVLFVWFPLIWSDLRCFILFCIVLLVSTVRYVDQQQKNEIQSKCSNTSPPTGQGIYYHDLHLQLSLAMVRSTVQFSISILTPVSWSKKYNWHLNK
jgi:hypothetical protein